MNSSKNFAGVAFFLPRCSSRATLVLSEAVHLLWTACPLPPFEGPVLFCSSRLCIWHLCSALEFQVGGHGERWWRDGGGWEEHSVERDVLDLPRWQIAGSTFLVLCDLCSTAVSFEVNCFHAGLRGELEVASGLTPGWLFLFKTLSSVLDTRWLRNSSRHKGTVDLHSRWPHPTHSFGFSTRTMMNAIQSFSKKNGLF